MAQEHLPRSTPSLRADRPRRGLGEYLRNKTLGAFLAGCAVSGGVVALFHRGAAPPSELGPGIGGALHPPGPTSLAHPLKRAFLDLLLSGGRRASQPSGAKDAESLSEFEEPDRTPFANREEEDLSAVEGRRYKLERGSPDRKSGLGTVLVGGVPAYRPTGSEVPGSQDAAPGTPGIGFAPAGARTAQDAKAAGGKKGAGPGASSKGGVSGGIQATDSRTIGGRGIKEGDLQPATSQVSPPPSEARGTGGTSGAEASPRRTCLDSGGKWQAGKCACPEGTELAGEPGRCQVPEERKAAAGCRVVRVADSPVGGHCVRVYCKEGGSCDIPDGSLHCNVEPGHELSCGRARAQAPPGTNSKVSANPNACGPDDYHFAGNINTCGAHGCEKSAKPKRYRKNHGANCDGPTYKYECFASAACFASPTQNAPPSGKNVGPGSS